MQAATRGPMPEQLEMWKEKHDALKQIQTPVNNANVKLWRDDPKAIDSPDFDPALLGLERDQKKRLFLERFDKPKELTESSH